jgi:mono/diheme cytochrome c family protein
MHPAFFRLRISVVLFIILGLASCTSSPEQLKYDQYFAEGSRLYSIHCSNCHQADGTGLKNLYPPLLAERLTDEERLACIIRYGLREPITINGQRYSQEMPGNSRLYTIEIAQIVTFITNEFGNRQEITTVQAVETALNACNPQP